MATHDSRGRSLAAPNEPAIAEDILDASHQENATRDYIHARKFANVVYDLRLPFKTRPRTGFLHGIPVDVVIFNVQQSEAAEHFSHRRWNPLLYEIHVTHGPYRWTLKKRYHNFLMLHAAIVFSGFENGGPPDNLAETDGRIPKAAAMRRPPSHRKRFVERLKSTVTLGTDEAAEQRVAYFPKKPDILLTHDDEIAKRRQQLEDYLNGILQTPAYRTLPELLEFFEVSEISFAQDLIKGKEGMVKKLAGGDQKRQGFLKSVSRGFRYLWTLLVGQRWYRVWLVTQDSYIFLIEPSSGEINAVLLLDEGFRVDTNPKKKNSLIIQNLSQTLTIRTLSSLRYKEWFDAIEEAIKKDHDFVRKNRFGSFAPVRHSSRAAFFVDGQDYMAKVADALLHAREEIFITDWWLSPEIYLKRGPDFNECFRLDRILKQKAEEGVRIFILIFKEFPWALALNSLYTKKALIHSNIKVLRHPDRISAEINFLWSHHEKLVVVDQRLAFVGGIDLCYGRWDNRKHRLTDLVDSVDKPGLIMPTAASTSSRPTPILQEGQHIIFGLKSAYDVGLAPVRANLTLDAPDATTVDEIRGREGRFRRGIRRAFNRARRRVDQDSDSDVEDGSNGERFARSHVRRGHRWRALAQKMRSYRVEPISSENSQRPHDAPDDIHASTATLWPAKDYVNFIVKDVARPDLPDQDNVDRRTTVRMPWHDVAVALDGDAAGDVARHFIQRWNAIKSEKAKFSRQYPYLVPRNACQQQPSFRPPPPQEDLLLHSANVKCQVLRSGCQWSTGSAKTEQSIYNAMMEAIQAAEHYIYIENQFFITSSKQDQNTTNEDDVTNEDIIRNRIGQALAQKVIDAHRNERQFRIFVLVPLLPGFEGDVSSPATGNAIRTVLHFNYAAICRGRHSLFNRIIAEGIDPAKYIAFCSLRQHGEILGTPVTELIYIHSKLLIVDDRLVICGSANVNDRSLVGNRDSEVAVVIEDVDFEKGRMNGKLANCGKFARSLRLKLMAEHLGLHELRDRHLIQDCACDHFFHEVWIKIAARNTRHFEETFLCVPTDQVETVEEMQKQLKERSLAETDKFLAMQKIKHIKGTLVLLPLKFLCRTDLTPSLIKIEGLVPTITWT